MDLRQTLRELEQAGTAQNRKVYARHGVKGPAFGVSYAAQGALAKRIGRDSELARGLWASGNHDARVLATMVADAEALARDELEAWAEELENYVLTDALAGLAARSAHAPRLIERWIASKCEWTSSAGWTTLSALLRDGGTLGDARLAELLARIESAIGAAPNRTRYAMLGALIAIGGYCPALRAAALAAAERIGPVEVDHGETGCKTPEPIAYIAKMAARHDARAAKGARGRAPATRGAAKRGAKPQEKSGAKPAAGPRAKPARKERAKASSKPATGRPARAKSGAKAARTSARAKQASGARPRGSR